MTLETIPPQRRARRRVAVAIVVVALVLVLGYSLWWSRPTAFDSAPVGTEVGATTQAGRPATMGLMLRRGVDDVTVRDIDPIVVENTAAADVDVVVCTFRGPDSVGVSFGSLEADCSDVTEVPRHDVENARRGVVLRITPRRPGVVRIDGADVSYSRDWRHAWQTGRQQTGAGLELTVS